MNILDTNTPLKVKHIIVGIILVLTLFFGYKTWKQVQVNRANISAIANFLNQANSPKAPQPKPPEIKKESNER